MDTNQWPQGGIGVVKPIETPKPAAAALERKQRPQKEHALNCPRCNSTNTKFCYYNNYSLSQPRYICKTCRRYWTEGGTLRNVPVGGGSRKNKRSSSSSSSSSATSAKKLQDLSHLNLAYQYPTEICNSATSNYLSGLIQFPNIEIKSIDSSNYPSNTPPPPPPPPSSSHVNSLLSMPFSDSNSIYYSSVIPAQGEIFKPNLNFSLDGFDQNGYGRSLNGVPPRESNSGRFFNIPCQDLKPVSMSSHQFNYHQQNRGQEGESTTTGYWNGNYIN